MLPRVQVIKELMSLLQAELFELQEKCPHDVVLKHKTRKYTSEFCEDCDKGLAVFENRTGRQKNI